MGALPLARNCTRGSYTSPPHTATARLLIPALSDPQVIAYGMSCKCMDILDYPSTIGICDNAGFHSPMAIASDCPATSAPGPVLSLIHISEPTRPY